ncbi:flagellar assembly protein FliW [Clostridium sp.]|uniref:flagellar assembly protein FliW n=1 Tax=Clostridium sp. TaxID=1506 RepID=UPI00260879B4|nr:flagellar assembly protein FliW [Clostridium sp.]
MDIIFKKGIPGFDSLREFIITDLEDNKKFKVLQSKESEISFVMTDPFEIYDNYEINLNDEIIKELEIKNPEDVLILSIITLGKTLETSTMNLKAPLVINIKNNLGKQYIMQNSKYETKHPLIRRD